MRKAHALMALCLVLGLTARVAAQQTSATSFFTGVDPRTIVSKPIDTSKALAAFNTTNAFPMVGQQRAFSLTNIFHPFTLPSWPPRLGKSIFPAGLLPQQQPTFQPLSSKDLPTMQVSRSTTVLPF
jgi:hypothetical protein